MTWLIDTTHSAINFNARHMMLSKVRGSFETFSGSIEFDEDDPVSSTVDIEINAASINTREDQRDDHLRSPDFLDVANYPTLTFHSTHVEQTAESRGKLIGDLTIRGVSRQVVLDVEYAGTAKSPWGATSAGFSAATTISRKEWGLNWNQILETGGFLVSDEIKIEIELELVKQPEAEAVAA